MGAIERDAHHNTTSPKEVSLKSGEHIHPVVSDEILGGRHSLDLLCKPKICHLCFHFQKDMQHHTGRAEKRILDFSVLQEEELYQRQGG